LSAPGPASPTAVLARYTVEASLDRVPAPVVQKVKELILDHLGWALGGSRTPLARAAEVAYYGAAIGGATIGAAPSKEGATVIGTPLKAAAGPAAFANATAANALDYDDTGPTGHPGATIIPAALCDQALGATGDPRAYSVSAMEHDRPECKSTESTAGAF
jgi:2-methylcitrate dehydratase PrpD